MNRLAVILKSERLNMGYRQEEMACKLKLSTVTYGRIERGHVKLGLKSLKTIARHLNVTPRRVRDLLYENHK